MVPSFKFLREGKKEENALPFRDKGEEVDAAYSCVVVV